MATISYVIGEMSMAPDSAVALLLKEIPTDTLRNTFPVATVSIVEGLQRVSDLYKVNTSLETDNFRMLLLSMAQDVRVLLLLIAGRLIMMRRLNTEAEIGRAHV